LLAVSSTSRCDEQNNAHHADRTSNSRLDDIQQLLRGSDHHDQQTQTSHGFIHIHFELHFNMDRQTLPEQHARQGLFLCPTQGSAGGYVPHLGGMAGLI